MTYLSKLTLNPTSRMVQKEIGNPYQLHRTVMRGFDLPREEARVLHRLDVAPSGAISLLVQSEVEPSWEPLETVGQGRFLLESPQSKTVVPHFRVGQLLRFRLQANPTVKKKRPNAAHSNRVPLKHEDEQREWLQRKGELHGFKVVRVIVSQDEQQRDWVQDDDRRHRLTLYTVQFDGILQVKDGADFAAAWRDGIGPAKAFGCGLLSLASA